MNDGTLNIDGVGRILCSSAAAHAVAGQGVDNPEDDPLPPNPLSKRRLSIIAFPTDAVLLGPSGVTTSSGYGVRGAGRSSGWASAPIGLEQHSSRAQFLRGQYTYLPVTDGVVVHGIKEGAIEEVATLELA